MSATNARMSGSFLAGQPRGQATLAERPTPDEVHGLPEFHYRRGREEKADCKLTWRAAQAA